MANEKKIDCVILGLLSHEKLTEYEIKKNRQMVGHFGFSYIGLIFLLLLFVPNIIWTRSKPQGYTSENENKILLFFERTGEVLTTICALIFGDFNLRGWSS